MPVGWLAATFDVRPRPHLVATCRPDEPYSLVLSGSQPLCPAEVCRRTCHPDDASTPRDFTLDPSGRFVLVANQGSGNVAVFAMDTTEGTLTMRSVMSPAGISQPQCVVAATRP